MKSDEAKFAHHQSDKPGLVDSLPWDTYKTIYHFMRQATKG